MMVAFDRNCNGVPDEDEWYELAGSEYHNPKTVKNYEITYTRPSVHAPVPNPQGTLTDTLYIPWTDNQGTQGISQNRFHTQSYYPEWLHDDKLTFQGFSVTTKWGGRESCGILLCALCLSLGVCRQSS